MNYQSMRSNPANKQIIEVSPTLLLNFPSMKFFATIQGIKFLYTNIEETSFEFAATTLFPKSSPVYRRAINTHQNINFVQV